MRLASRAALLVLLLAVPGLSAAQSAENVLVVINDASPASMQIGEYYIHKRAIPQDHVVHLKTATTEGISRADYARTLEQPIGSWLMSHQLVDKVLYIVLTKGVPLRVDGTSGLQGTVASVDSELTLAYRRFVGSPAAPVVGRVANPYYLGEQPLSEAKPFSRLTFDLYLVTRLDGYTVDDVLKLIDRAMAPSTNGKIVLDQRASLLDAGGDRWLQQAADRVRQATTSDTVVLDMSKSVVSTDSPVLGYYSWGSNDPANRLRHFGLHFAPGAIAGMFVSTDGRTFTEPPADWVPGGTDQRGYGSQSLAGDLIRDGVTGVSAHVTEPFLDATIRPQILFPAYLRGFTLAESYYLAMPFLSWQTVIVGDPLCAPFARQPVPADQLARGIDPDTLLPASFSDRRVAFLATGGLSPAAIKLFLRAGIEQESNKADAEKDYAEAFRLEPRFALAALQLAMIYEQREDYAKGIEVYRKALQFSPSDPLILNNLAYSLAEHQHNPTDALPLAEKAYGLARLPNVADTLAWIHHLRGDDHLAAPLIEQALGAVKDNADFQLHAAFIHAGLGDLARARTELDAAVKLNSALADGPDVKALREKIK